MQANTVLMRDDEDDGSKTHKASRIIEDSLFKKRYVFITGTINEKKAKGVAEHLLALAADNDDPINIFISSPGGHVESGDMIHDIIKFIKPVVRTIGSGWVASAGALIFVAADKENRFCLPNTRFLLHQPSGGVEGMAGDIAIQAKQMIMMRDRFEQIFADATGQTPEKIKADTARDFWLNVDEALKYGLLGKMIRSQSELEGV